MRLVLKTRRSEFMTNPTPEVESTAATIIGRTMFRTCLIGLKRDCEEWSDRVLEDWRMEYRSYTNKLPNPISSLLILGLLRIIIDEVILCKPDFKSLLAEDLPSPIPSRIASRLSRPAKERSQRFNRKSSLGGPI